MKNKSGILSLLISLVIIGLLGYLVHQQYNQNSENYKVCVCQQGGTGRESACQDVTTVNNLYVTGQLTETTEQKGKGWTKVSPGDIDFPVNTGCDWATHSGGKDWMKWDYTDFGN
jgi:hypothetical protein